MCGNEQFSYETCHLVYLELGFNFQILFQSHIMLRLWDVAESELWMNHSPSVYSAPRHCPAAKQWKEFYIIWWVWKVSFAMGLWTKKQLSGENLLRYSQCLRVKGRGIIEEFKKSKKGTIGTREAEQKHIRGTTRGQKMYSRGTEDEKRRYNRGPTPNWEYII